MTREAFEKFCRIARNRARETGRRQHVIRCPDLLLGRADFLVLRQDNDILSLPSGAVRIYSTPIVGRRRRRFYR